MTNTNNPIEFLLSLGINTPDSKTNISNAITQIQKDLKQELDVTLSVKSTSTDNKVFTEMEKQIKELQKQIDVLNKELSDVGKKSASGGGSQTPFKPLIGDIKDVTYSLDELKRKAIESNASLDFKYAGNDLTKYKSAVIGLRNEFGELEKVKFQALYNDVGDFTGFKALETATKNTDFDNFNKNQREATRLLKEFEKQGNMSSEQIREFKKAISSAGDNKSLDDTVEKLKQVNNEASRNIKHSSISEINRDAETLLKKINQLAQSTGINTTTDEFKRLTAQVTDLSQRKVFNDQDLKTATKDFSTLNTQVNALVASSNKFDNVNNKINKLVVDLGNLGTLDKNTLNNYSADIMEIGRSSDSVSDKIMKLKTMLNQIQTVSDSVNHQNSMASAMEKARREAESLSSALTKVEHQWKRSVNKNDVAKVRGEINAIQIPNFSNQAQVTKFMEDLGRLRGSITNIASESTQAARSSMGVIESFKVAMERFPIWMAASTVFYGAIRGVTDLTTKVIELDTHMTMLRRVMDMPDHKFNEMLERSIDNVTALSGKMQEYMKFVEEFGRMGFDDVETIDMSNTAATLSNISDLNADDSVNALVAAMISFNVEASKSISIADKLNEVDNTFSVTTKNLAQGLNKASATATTFGK